MPHSGELVCATLIAVRVLIESFRTDDFYLIPTIENDPLLRAPHLFAGDDESWSDDEEELQAAREEALSRQKELFASLRAAGAM